MNAATGTNIPKPAPAAAGETFTTLLAADHRGLIESWNAIQDGIARDDFKLIESSAIDFNARLLRHVEVIDRVLCAAIERKLGTGGFGPTEEASGEHAQMRAMLPALKKLETVTELWTAINVVEGQPADPGALLRSHAAKEEVVIGAIADKIFSAEEGGEMLRRLRDANVGD
jgi:Hemerythrin HHE cation binding domain